MAWEFADYMKKQGAERIATLEAHIAEVEAAIDVDVSADGKSINRGTLEAKVTRLQAYLKSLQTSAANRPGGGFSSMRVR